MGKDANIMTANVIPVVDQSQTAAVGIPNPVSAVESHCKLLPTVLDEGALFQVISDFFLLVKVSADSLVSAYIFFDNVDVRLISSNFFFFSLSFFVCNF